MTEMTMTAEEMRTKLAETIKARQIVGRTEGILSLPYDRLTHLQMQLETELCEAEQRAARLAAFRVQMARARAARQD